MTKPYGRIYKNKTNVSIDALDLYNVWPVGSIYISVNNTNPSTYFGGTWVSFGAGRCLVGIDTLQAEFNVVEKIGGEMKHTLSVEEMPAHRHGINVFSPESGHTGRYTCNPEWNNRSSDTEGIRWIGDSGITGQTTPHNNLQPYITVYMWKRTA